MTETPTAGANIDIPVKVCYFLSSTSNFSSLKGHEMPDYHIDTEEDHIGQVETVHNGTPYDVRYFSSIADPVELHERNITITAVVNCNTMEHIDPMCATARTIIQLAMSSILEEEKEVVDAIGEIDDF